MENLSIHLGFNPDDPTGIRTVDSLAAALPTTADVEGSSSSSLEIYLSPTAKYSPMDLSAFSKHLKAGATVTIHIAAAAAVDADSENKNPAKSCIIPSLQDVHNSILLAGLRSVSERRLDDGSRILVATKQAPLTQASLAAAPIRINLVDDIMDNGDDDDFIDEDGLLNDSTLLAAPPAMSAVKVSGDDCAGREPCADCTCGRSDASKAATNSNNGVETKKVETSACGKCGLGDAFRCASCPYLGKPAFEAGEEHLVLDLQDDF
jgi:Cytokine-induced anti-apoptosis inhibitor 1, Fe-S biogenesis